MGRLGHWDTQHVQDVQYAWGVMGQLRQLGHTLRHSKGAGTGSVSSG